MANFLLDLIYGSEDEDEEPPRIRRMKDLTNPFDGFSNRQIYDRYRFSAEAIMALTDLLQGDIERPTKRSRPIPPLHQVCIMLRYVFLVENLCIVNN